ncbi:MAG: hypothetical protein UY18_C0002G0038 [Microgenomates group bacterium GW2011_GWF2_47_9]|nr:MAG: hypothetical protein UY18_C0002G0038 [Microgenomates group bacterium GW2011_GWF2_47_9]
MNTIRLNLIPRAQAAITNSAVPGGNTPADSPTHHYCRRYCLSPLFPLGWPAMDHGRRRKK